MIRSPGSRIYLWYLKGERLLETGRLFLFLRNSQMYETKLSYFFKKEQLQKL